MDEAKVAEIPGIRRLAIVAGVLCLLFGVLAWMGYTTVRQERLDAALIIMVNQGTLAGVEHKLKAGANPDVRYAGDKPSNFRTYLGLFVRRLLHRNDPADHRPTALILSASHPHPEIVRALLVAGAHTEYRDTDGRTALITAAYAGQAGNLQALLERGANVNAVDDKDRTALMGAAVLGYASSVDVLLAHKADVNRKTVYGRTALMWAAGFHYPDVVKSLVAVPGIDINCQDKEGKSALLYALGDGAPNITRPSLVTGQPFPNLYESVWPRVEPQAWQTIHLLLTVNADTRCRDTKGISIFQQAHKIGDPYLIKTLKLAGAQ